MRTIAALLTVFPLLALACSKEAAPKVAEGPEWSAWDLQAPNAREDVRLLNAERARATMFNRLLPMLQEILKEQGPAAAISICGEQAPAIALEVGEELGLRIGRSGVRLRNPVNTGPEWAADGIAKSTKTKMVWEKSDGTLGVLTPIQTASACLVCHGGPDDLGEGVADALAEHYPEDAATGFAEGDLRGWFWVESPPVADAAD